MTTKRLLLLAIAMYVPSTATAQAYGPSGKQTPTWVQTPTIGNPGNTVSGKSEVFTDTQGGQPPALAYEATTVDDAGTKPYVRNNWIVGDGINRQDQLQAKFRTNCAFVKFAIMDPILMPGMDMFGHDHTFFGNINITSSSDYTSLRNSPKSSCAGGPLNATAYWTTTLHYEPSPGVVVPVKPNIVTFYYNLESYVGADHHIRFFNNMAFIGGVNPRNRSNSSRLAEVPSGFDTASTKPGRYDGWYGWQCNRISDGANITPTGSGVFPDLSPDFTRNLVNVDANGNKTDPWNGQCDGPNFKLIANIVAPPCWDGKNLRSPDGRDHFRYPLYRSGFGSEDDRVCPDHWYWVMHFEVKEEYPAYTFAMRQKMYLSSDHQDEATGLITSDSTKWATPGSTKHFDWMGAWDSVVRDTWLRNCVGTRVNGTSASDFPDGRTCGDSTISQTQRMMTSNPSPDPSLSNNPVITEADLGASGTPSKVRFGPVVSGTVNATIRH